MENRRLDENTSSLHFKGGFQDVTILVWGISGSKKSTFINWVAESFSLDPNSQLAPVRKGMKAQTTKVQEVVVIWEGVSVRLVDTPGFDHTAMSNRDTLVEIGRWLRESFKRGTGVKAVLYLHDIYHDPGLSSMRLDVRVLRELCGPEALDSGIVTIVTTMWGRLTSEEEGVWKEKELAGGLWLDLGPSGQGCPPIRRIRDKNSVKAFMKELLPHLLKAHYTPLKVQQGSFGAEIPSDPPKRPTLKQGGSGSPISPWARHTFTIPDPVPLESKKEIVIMVMGPTKSGKSFFLNQLLGRPQFKVGGRLASCTETVSSHVTRRAPEDYAQHGQLNALLGGRRIILVDTPGFDHSRIGDYQILERISDWLVKEFNKDAQIGGALYFHDITNEGVPPSLLRSITLFSKISRSAPMDRVAIVTTKWDLLQDDQEGSDRMAELSNDPWKEMIESGTVTFRLSRPQGVYAQRSNPYTTPWGIIHQVVTGCPRLNAG